MANRRPPARNHRDSRATLILVLVIVALLMASAALVVVMLRTAKIDPDEPTPSTPATTTEPAAEATTEPTTEPPATTPEPEETTTPDDPEPILLSGSGIGAVPLDTPDAQAGLEALFGGPPTSTSPGNDDCGGPGALVYLTWGDLRVWLSGGSLYGWGIRGNALPDGVQVATGIGIGTPYSEVAALPGAVPEYMENFRRIVTNVDGIGYWSTEGSDVAAVTVFDIQVRPIVCG